MKPGCETYKIILLTAVDLKLTRYKIFYCPFVHTITHDRCPKIRFWGFEPQLGGLEVLKICMFLLIEEYARALHRCSVSRIIIMTVRKLTTTMPSLKPPVEKMIRSSTGIICKITCACCTACYVGQSSRHLQTCFREHTGNPGPVKTPQ